ncbi:MAG: SMP-30/gluconolactonase/LRE family protein [Solirubrobacterales bacterium]
MDALSPVRSALGESPLWAGRSGEIVWIDIEGGDVHRARLAGGSISTTFVGPSSTIVEGPGGSQVLVSQRGLRRLRGTSDEWLSTVPVWDSLHRMNDGAVDPSGRLLVGSMCRAGAPPRTASLWRLGRDGWRVVADGVTISNGIDWSPDGTTMFYVDTPTHRVDAFDYDPATGELHSSRPFIEVPESAGDPDGLCVDAEGGIWLALWGGGEVRRYVGRRLSARIRVPAPFTTSVCFAGPALDHLVITTAAGPHGNDRPPGAGLTFVTRPGIGGRVSTTLAHEHLPTADP